jgi:hypothetical protein
LIVTKKLNLLFIKNSSIGEINSVPSSSLVGLLQELGTLNNRHEQLRALVEALEV